jgi:hypothetical protein
MQYVLIALVIVLGIAPPAEFVDLIRESIITLSQ